MRIGYSPYISVKSVAMKTTTRVFRLLAVLLFFSFPALAQSPPWNSPLIIRTGSSATSFGTAAIFQDSSGVPSLIRIGSASSDTLLCAFQWFPSPMNSAYWDKIAVKFSYDGGTTWTTPTSCVFTGLPSGNQRPFDPGLIQLSNGQIRMYFSSSVNNPPAGGVDTYSAVSTDGIHYTVEGGVRFDHASFNAIDPTVALFNGTYYYDAWTNVMSDGAHQATSTDGLTFTTNAMLPYDNNHLWLGNYMNDGSTLRFYGCGNGMWMSSSTDGVTWSSYTTLAGIMGADPTVAKNQAGTYILIYTGPPNLTGMQHGKPKPTDVTMFPNPAATQVQLFVPADRAEVQFYNAAGQCVKSLVLPNGTHTLDISELPAGLYEVKCTTRDGLTTHRLVKR